MEQARPQATISAYFSVLEDPRRYNRRHKLLDILVVAIVPPYAEPTVGRMSRRSRAMVG